MSTVLGIDLGTTNSAVAAFVGGAPRVIPSRDGGLTIPSVVSLRPGGAVVVGRRALEEAARWPSITVFSVKRLMGRDHEKAAEEARHRPCALVAGHSGAHEMVIGGRRRSPPEIASWILLRLKEDAAAFLGQPVTRAVVGVPAYFDGVQREATCEAARLAGLEVVRLLNEPTAAAVAYGLDLSRDQTIAVYDFGGGTFDVSLLRVTGTAIEVLATCGDTQLGGGDIDRRIVSFLCAEDRIALPGDPGVWRLIEEAAEAAKVALSSVDAAEIHLPPGTAEGGKAGHRSLTRAELEDLSADLIDRTLIICRTALADADLRPAEIDAVILVGAPTRMPLVRRRLGEFFGRTPLTTVDPDLAVALGAAAHAAALGVRESGRLLLDVTPLSLGVETLGGLVSVLIPRNTTIPARRTRTFSTAEDGMDAVTLHVVQGERPLARDNRSLGRFDLAGLPALPRGVPRIEVTFDIDADGLIHVAATDLGTGAYQGITVLRDRSGDARDAEAALSTARQNAEADAQALREAQDRVRLHHLLAALRSCLRRERRRIARRNAGRPRPGAGP
ncbi:MAG: Hsp70 family protein, partial [Myxococcota bacterium]|nr:Hsp70 family protein [Myxococcota bacterium]